MYYHNAGCKSKLQRNNLRVIDGGRRDDQEPGGGQIDYKLVSIVGAIIFAHVILIGYFGFIIENSDFYKYTEINGMGTSPLDLLWLSL